MSMCNAELDGVLAAVERGESAAFMRLVEANRLMIRSYIGAQVFNGSDVEDLAQETFIAAYRSLASYRRGSDFGAWMRGIARNKVLMYFRSVGRRSSAFESFRQEVVSIASEELEVQSRLDREAQIEALLRCVGKLPEKLRRVVRSGLEGMKAQALAEFLETTTGAVHQLHYRANQLLRECMKREVSDV